MPSEEAKSSLVIVLTHTKVESPLFGQYVGCETVISKKHSGNWLYVLKNETSKSFDEFESAINAMDTHLKADTHCIFLPSGTRKWQPDNRQSPSGRLRLPIPRRNLRHINWTIQEIGRGLAHAEHSTTEEACGYRGWLFHNPWNQAAEQTVAHWLHGERPRERREKKAGTHKFNLQGAHYSTQTKRDQI